MKKIIFIFFIISQYTFAQLVVHSKNDKRLIAYRDSIKCYLHGLKEVRVAKLCLSYYKNDTSIGRQWKYYIEDEQSKLNQNIKPIKQFKQYGILYNIIPLYENHLFYTVTYLQEVRWIPEMWKKPVIKVVYEKEKKEPLVLKKDTVKKSITYRYVFRINGNQVSEKEFEKVYGRKVLNDNYDSLMKMRNKITKN